MEKGIKFHTSNYFRQKLVLSVLSIKSIIIKDIRVDEDGLAGKIQPWVVSATNPQQICVLTVTSVNVLPHVRRCPDFEVNFLELLHKLMDGSYIKTNETGTKVNFRPGKLLGGKIEFTCHNSRPIGYYLEHILALGPFGRTPFHLVLKGITNDNTHVSVDRLKRTCLPILSHFLGTNEGLELTVTKRGLAPDGGGAVVFKCPCKRQLRPVRLTDPGLFKRIGGLAYTSRVNPTLSNRVIEAAKSALPPEMANVFIKTQHSKKNLSGRSPGFGLCMVAETSTGIFVAAEKTSAPPNARDEPPTIPEDLGAEVAAQLRKEMSVLSCVDHAAQPLALMLMALGPQDVSKLLMPPVGHL
ncbi:RCL1 [Cordylochernes scorpioides]|uniref:RCL1 n=1 Tax=Cordylochernes scorpioides TaxID=51811 RepID=A0ABY6JVM8_9ARAC|nr:RCL1 [Cordylochernes scorpioides]